MGHQEKRVRQLSVDLPIGLQIRETLQRACVRHTHSTLFSQSFCCVIADGSRSGEPETGRRELRQGNPIETRESSRIRSNLPQSRRTPEKRPRCRKRARGPDRPPRAENQPRLTKIHPLDPHVGRIALSEAKREPRAESRDRLPRGFISISTAINRGHALVRRIVREPRLMREAGWVILGKVVEFGLLFVSLKLMTTLMPQSEVGGYQLIQSSLMLLGIALLGPVQNGYHRYFHTAEERGERRGAGVILLRWYSIATAAVLALGVIFAVPLAHRFEIGTVAVMLGGLIFFVDRWRMIALEVLEIRRLRRSFALQASGHLILQVTLLWTFLTVFEPDATAALSAQGTAALVFSIVAVAPFLRMILSGQPRAQSGLMETVRRFGAPYSVLLICQWLQLSVDRFVIDQMLDKASVGLYVTAYQITGVPFMLLVNIGSWFLLPIAYQRARDIDDPAQLWAADKIFVGGIAAYVVIGLVAVAGLSLGGPALIVALSSAEYELPTATVIALSIGRYIQCLAFLIQPIFAVHQRMTSSLVFRVIGAALAVPICWLGVKWGGVHGAAVATIISSLLYAMLLIAGPGGCLWLVLRSRADSILRANASQAESADRRRN